jgi:NAD(P)-dependent dehydrogenase (short-subunit alcohol dehydrogenase family)
MLAAHGAKIVVNDLGGTRDGSGASLGPAEEVVQEITKAGGEAIANGDDISDFAGAKRLIDAAIARFGKLDVLVNNAGILRDRMLVNMTEEEWDAVIRVHLKGTFCTTRWAAAYWRERTKAGEPNDARVINTSSGSGLYGNPGQSNYGAAKSGIASFSVIVGKELARYGVTVNAIAPGARTRMTMSVPGAAARPEPAADEFDRRDPANVAPLVVWLGSPGSAAVNGQVFNVAGGMIGIAENWRRGPSRDKGDRWSPAEVGDVVPQLLAEVAPPA